MTNGWKREAFDQQRKVVEVVGGSASKRKRERRGRPYGGRERNGERVRVCEGVVAFYSGYMGQKVVGLLPFCF